MKKKTILEAKIFSNTLILPTAKAGGFLFPPLLHCPFVFFVYRFPICYLMTFTGETQQLSTFDGCV